MQLLKLVYLCHGWMLGLYGRPLSKEPAEAWTYGPVMPSVYRDFKVYRGDPITDIPNRPPLGLSVQEESVIKQIWKAYSKYTGVQLSALTHQEGTPWQVTKKYHGESAPISNALIELHYRGLLQDAGSGA